MGNNNDRACFETASLYEREIIRICRDYEMKNDISDTEFWILYVLHDNADEMTQTDICNSLYAPRQSTNSALKRLEQDGTVEKHAVPGNLKSKHIVLTEKGVALTKRIIAPMKRAEQDVFASFTDDENRIYLEIVRKRCALFRTLIGENSTEESVK